VPDVEQASSSARRTSGVNVMKLFSSSPAEEGK
jgi:hypothetical protein